MAFNLRVSFTGICALVPDTAFDKKPSKVCVVMPYGELKEPRDAKDGTRLRRHLTMVQFNMKNLKCDDPLPKRNHGVWYLDRERLTFVTTGDYEDLDVAGLKKLCDMTEIAPEFSAVDPVHLKWSKKPQVSQVMFKHGTLGVDVFNKMWSVPNTLSHDYIYREQLAFEVTLKMTGLKSLELLARSLSDKSKETRLPLYAPEGGEVRITIANLCDDNPLRWDVIETKRLPDEDFKWYFELLHPRQDVDLKKARRGLPLPIPLPVGSVNGRGVNCVPAGMQPSDFTFD